MALGIIFRFYYCYYLAVLHRLFSSGGDYVPLMF